jgi:hypothetical protein
MTGINPRIQLGKLIQLTLTAFLWWVNAHERRWMAGVGAGQGRYGGDGERSWAIGERC